MTDPNPLSTPPTKRIVQLENVQVRFGQGDDAFLALDRTNLVVHPGDFVAWSVHPAAANRRS